MRPRGRAVGAAAVLPLGLASCFVMYGRQPLVFVAPFVYGTIGNSIIFALDHVVRHRRWGEPRPR
jgi:hypothetical protein